MGKNLISNLSKTFWLSKVQKCLLWTVNMLFYWGGGALWTKTNFKLTFYNEGYPKFAGSHVWQLSTLYLCLSQEGDAEEGGHGVEPALGVAVARVADLHVDVFKDAAGIRVLRLALKQMK